MSAIDNLMKGSIDMHIHFSPDFLMERRQDAMELTRSAKELGMRAIVLKSREFNTVPLALLANKLNPEVQVFGSFTLDNEVGGLNTAGALAAARMGAKVIWMPTITAANSKAKAERIMGLKLPGEGQFILDSSGKLKSEAREILHIVKDFNIVLASGHLSPREIFALADESQRVGFSKMIITHPLQSQLMDEALSIDELKQIASTGAIIEHCFWGWMPTVSKSDPKQIVEAVKAIGAEKCIMSSDFGQFYHPTAPEGMRLFIATMLRNGLDEKDIGVMVKTNPAKLLDLE